MKRILTLLSGMVLLIGLRGNSQIYVNVPMHQPPLLFAHAGSDTVTCPDVPVMIGGNPSASGGTPAYSYNWSSTGAISSTSVANPNAAPSTTSAYYLTVTDSRSCVARDTVIVTVDTCTGITDWNLDLSVSLFPNPAHGEFTVRVEGSHKSEVTLKLLSLEGKTLHAENLGRPAGRIEKSFAFDFLSPGIYFVELQSGASRLSRRLVIQ